MTRTRYMPIKHLASAALSVCLAWVLGSSPCRGIDGLLAEGFTEPFRTVEVAAPEMGIVAEIFVREGQVVREGQMLATLDQDVYRAQLAVAEQNAQAVGGLRSAQAEFALRQERVLKLQELLEKGFARPEEISRAQADLKIAESNLLSVQEDLGVKRLEVARLKVQLERRSLRAPMDGVITRLHKQIGEFMAPNDPKLLTLVQLDPLAASFSISSIEARNMRAGQAVLLLLDGEPKPAAAVIDFVAPVTDAESGTVRVKVRLDNPQGKYRSGERCTLQLAPTRPNRT